MAKLLLFDSKPERVGHYPVTAHVKLSERNLLSLLVKLYTDGSECTIVNNDVERDGESQPTYVHFAVEAEKDDVHYHQDRYPPGPMHPTTEKVLKAIKEALNGEG